MRKKFAPPRKDTGEPLEQLQRKRDTLQKELEDVNSKQPIDFAKQSVITYQISETEFKLSQARDWYGLSLLQGLEHESWTLKWLTIVLIALTLVLAIFTGCLVFGIKLSLPNL